MLELNDKTNFNNKNLFFQVSWTGYNKYEHEHITEKMLLSSDLMFR